MKKLYSPKVVKDIIDFYGFRFSKSLGQNFLIDKNFVDKIVEGADVGGKNVIEVGPGIGTISYEMAKIAKKLVLIEIDSALIPILEENMAEFDNVEIIHADILKTDLKEVQEKYFGGEEFVFVSNLPYYITTPIIEKIFEEDIDCTSMTIMVQKEVADRMVATEKDKDYSSLSVFVKYYSDAKKITKVPKSVFMPQPKIDSTVLKLDLREYKKDIDKDKLFALVRAGFEKRRKTIVNSLSAVADKEDIKKALANLGLKENLRAENLSLDDFINISKELENC
uniref:16S rRNA (adenine(1518)-N(6)/adenine(1519)-N(6))- dimethyltransferase RsmA n=1 Tax=Anaerococcus mediterraneensis TaxID=1870984 RepID=UPI0009306F7B|nr:16S rRNA (adenine(1518)-N(6)/adenine(1519)-N(6))-dimethyltransferase RsmA [Anaerococcus mediterraneensis]